MKSEHLENSVNNQRNDLFSANEIIKKCQAMLEKLSNEKLEMDSLRRTNAELEEKVSKLNTTYKVPGSDADRSLDSKKQTLIKEKSISQLLQYQNQNAEFEKGIELEKREKEFQTLNRKLIESQELQKDMMKKIEFLSENLSKESKNLPRLNNPPPIQVIPLYVNVRSLTLIY
jgi:acyl carrier protein phosphodiesterase